MIDKAIVWVVLENAVWVALLAIVVESVTRWTKSYRLANLLWLLVLIKFFIPPMVHLDLPLPINQLSISQQAPPHAEGERIPPKFELQFATALANSNSVIAESTDGQESSSNASLHGVTDNRTKDVDTNKFVAVTAWSKMFHGLGRMSFYSWILVGWTCISCVWFALLAIRLWRFHRQLAGLLITEESTNEVLTTVARKVGMGGAATVRTVDVQMSPIVTVGLRSTRIILPTKFLQTTSRDGLIATIAHELAHVRRGDHWVQRFALFAIGIFWWHPAAWFAVKRLRQSQDICCDMDVLIWFPKLSIPYAEALVEAAALTQRVSPAFALAFSDQHSLRSRIECVLRREATPQWSKVRVACLMGIGSLLACLSLRAVTMATSNENVTETVAEHTQDTKQTNAKQSVTRFFTAPVQAEIEVIETDGNRATNVVCALGGRHSSFSLTDQLVVTDKHEIPNRIRTVQSSNGLLSLDFEPGEEFLAVWSEAGFYKIAISRLAAKQTIRLEKWAAVEVHSLFPPDPPQRTKLAALNNTTSDGRYQGLTVSCKTEIDYKVIGRLIRIPAGENRLSVEGGIIKSEPAWSACVWLEPGEYRVIKLGEGRMVHGKLALPDGLHDITYGHLECTIKSVDTNQTFDAMISDDGTFECGPVPFGASQLEVRIRHTNSNREFRAQATKKFTCLSDGPEPLSIGAVEIEIIARQSNVYEAIGDRVEIQDSFQSSDRAVLVGITQVGEEGRFVLLNADGNSIRLFDQIGRPSFWGGTSQYVTVDFRRDRVYMLSDTHSSLRRETLFTSDLSGKLIAKMPLETNKSHRATLDTSTGNLWLLGVISVGKTDIRVIDTQGIQVATYPIDAFTLCYSSVDQAIWTVGSTKVCKLDPKNGEIQGSFQLPDGIWTLTSVVPCADGGIVAVEQMHPDLPSSANRIWRFDSNAELIASADVGSMHIKSIATYRDEVWVTGFNLRGIWSNPAGTRTASLVLNRSLEQLGDRRVECDVVMNAIDGKSIWGIRDKQLHRFVQVDTGGQIVWEKLQSPEIEAIWNGR